MAQAAAARPAPATAPTAPRASRLGAVQTGRVATARRILLFSDGGLGKTTLAAGAPRPIFIDVNQGSQGFDVARYVFDDGGRTKAETFDEVLAAVDDVAANGAKSYGTLVIDALSDVEQLVWAAVVEADKKAHNIEEVGGGFQKGYIVAVDEWRRLVASLERAWRAGLHILLIDHQEVKKDKNAAGADYGCFMPKIHPAASRFLHRWCDYTFFLEIDRVLVPDNADERKAKKVFAQSDGKRLLHARPAAEWMAKSRPELPDPITLPKFGGWQVIESQIVEAQRQRVADLRASIEQRLEAMSGADAEKIRGALERAGDDDSKLEQLDNFCAERARRA